MRCPACTGGAERCEREGHLRSHETSTMGDIAKGKRLYFCDRCHKTFEVEVCEGCAEPLAPAQGVA